MNAVICQFIELVSSTSIVRYLLWNFLPPRLNPDSKCPFFFDSAYLKDELSRLFSLLDRLLITESGYHLLVIIFLVAMQRLVV